MFEYHTGKMETAMYTLVSVAPRVGDHCFSCHIHIKLGIPLEMSGVYHPEISLNARRFPQAGPRRHVLHRLAVRGKHHVSPHPWLPKTQYQVRHPETASTDF